MQKFKVGQKVRIVATTSHPRLVKETGVVVGRKRYRFDCNPWGMDLFYGYRIRLDADGLQYNAQEECLAPIGDLDDPAFTVFMARTTLTNVLKETA